MRAVSVVARQPWVFVAGVAVGAALVALGFGLALVLVSGRSAEAQVGSGNIAACVSLYTGEAHFRYPGQPANCGAGEYAIGLGSGAAAADVEARLSALEAQVPACLSDEAGDAVFTGCDVEIRNGLGSTETKNGKGNLIVGYNENSVSAERNGSHNIVAGINNAYTSYGGLVVGKANEISGAYASVSGGQENIASGDFSSVSGGVFNQATGGLSSVSAGFQNLASGSSSSVSGGDGNTASGDFSSVGGGLSLTANVNYQFLP